MICLATHLTSRTVDELSRNEVILTLGVAFIAAASGLFGSWMARRDRDQAERVRRRKRGGEAIAPVLLLLEEANPIDVSINKSDVTPQKMQRLH